MRQRTPGAALTTRLRGMFSHKGGGPWRLAVHVLEKGRNEGIKDAKAYNAVLKARKDKLLCSQPAVQGGVATKAGIRMSWVSRATRNAAVLRKFSFLFLLRMPRVR